MNPAHADVLLVDDNPQDAELVTDILRRHVPDVNVLRARGGAQAIEIIQGLPALAWPSVTLLDLKLPKVDGFEVLRTLKGSADTRGVPVVVLTSSAQHRDVQLAYSLGANSYVVKPQVFEEFTELLGRVAEYWLRINRGFRAGSEGEQSPR